MRVDWRLVCVFSSVGAYFLARFLGASVLGGIGIALIPCVILYWTNRLRRGGPGDPKGPDTGAT